MSSLKTHPERENEKTPLITPRSIFYCILVLLAGLAFYAVVGQFKG